MTPDFPNGRRTGARQLSKTNKTENPTRPDFHKRRVSVSVRAVTQSSIKTTETSICQC